jgi:transcriptional regulator with XRE-family HTH domain
MARSIRRPAHRVAAIIARNVRTLREGRGESQQGFAQRAGFNRTNLNRLENGLRDPTLPTLVKIANALGVEPWELLWDRGMSAARPTAPKFAEPKKPNRPIQPRRPRNAGDS